MSHRRMRTILQTTLLIQFATLSFPWVTVPVRASARVDLDQGVVKIESKADGTGTGIVVCIEGNNAYIVTAEHVVGNDEYVDVSLFPRDDITYKGRVRRTFGGKEIGLALIVLLRTNLYLC